MHASHHPLILTHELYCMLHDDMHCTLTVAVAVTVTVMHVNADA